MGSNNTKGSNVINFFLLEKEVFEPKNPKKVFFLTEIIGIFMP